MSPAQQEERQNEVLKCLSVIIDPDLGRNIVELGFIKNLSITDEGVVEFEIELTSAACPVKDKFKAQARELVLGLSWAKSVSVMMTSQSSSATKNEDQHKNLEGVRNIIAITSGKGGVGKSMVAATMAVALARKGYRVGFVDIDIYGPSAAVLFGAQRGVRQNRETGALLPAQVAGLSLMSFSFLAGDTPALVRGPIVSRYVQQLILQTEWGDLDYLFIDTPPGTGDIHITLSQIVPVTGSVIVTTGHDLSVVDVAKGIIMLEKIAIPVLGIVENMSYLSCCKCGEENALFSTGHDNWEERLGFPCLGRWPLDLSILSQDFSKEEQELPKFVLETVEELVRKIGVVRLRENTAPTVTQTEENIDFSWKSKNVTWGFKELRLACRCSFCYDSVKKTSKLNDDQIKEDIAPIAHQALGNYAIAIRWNDGHNSAIYTYENLRILREN